MTTKLFDLDSYVLKVESEVESCELVEKNSMKGWAVVLKETCFFPEGGGQPADIGTLGDANVLYTYEKDGLIYHLCDEQLQIGETVEGKVSFPERFLNMQTHSGEHILSGIALKTYNLKNVGFHMGREFNTIDLDGELDVQQCEMLERRVNEAITSNAPVKVYYPDRDTLQTIPLRKKPEVEDLRVVEVTGFDYCGCCGTHVAHTGEIGLLKILDSQRYKGGTRISFICGFKALEDYQKKHNLLKQTAESFSCKPLEVAENIERLNQELITLKTRLSEKNNQIIGYLGEKLLSQSQLLPYADNQESIRWVFVASDSMNPDEVKTFAMAMSKEKNVLCTAFSLGKSDIKYALSRSEDATGFPIKELCQRINQSFEGKGGGRELCCGSIKMATEEEIKNIIKTFIA